MMNCPSCAKEFSLKESMKFYSWWGGRVSKSCEDCGATLILKPVSVILLNSGSLVILLGLVVRIFISDVIVYSYKINVLALLVGSALMAAAFETQTLELGTENEQSQSDEPESPSQL